MGENGIKHVEDNFSLKKHIKILEENLFDLYLSGTH